MNGTSPFSRSFVALGVWLGLACALAGARAGASDLDDIGYTALAGRPGVTLYRGAGVPVAQVEVPPTGTGNYAPDTSDPQLAGRVFALKSGATAVSPHASLVGQYFYGDKSAAHAIPSVNLYAADSFVAGVLRTGREGRAPGATGAMVLNNSWVAGFTKESTNIDTVRRLDDLVARDGLLVFNALPNDATAPFPRLLATSYNGIAVGTLTGGRGPVVFDSPYARLKPDLVAPGALTSTATALASSCGAELRSEALARGLPAGQLAIKAILMAGAKRDATWRRGSPSGKDNSVSPLDYQQGAGQLRIDRAYDILLAGRQAQGTTISAAKGWDFARTARGSGEALYHLSVGATIPAWSAVLTWNRTITGLNEDGEYDSRPTLPNFSLSLLQYRRGRYRPYAACDSPGDNVETLTLANVEPGDYRLVLRTDVRSYYGLAWYAGADSIGATSAAAIPAGSSAVPFAVGGPVEPAEGLGARAVPEPPLLLMALPLVAWYCSHRPRGRGSRGG